MRLHHVAAILCSFVPAGRLYAPVFEPVRIVDARPVRTVKESLTVAQLLDAAADRYNIPRALLRRRAWAESRFNPKARSKDGCYGVMQLNSRVSKGAAKMSPAQNIDRGARFLAEKLRACRGDWKCAERAYRGGRVRR